jgi:hypothetical protein
MRTLLFITTTSLIACAAESPSENQATQASTANNKISSNKISSNKISSNKISSNKISSNKISSNKLSVNIEAAGDLLSTPDGQEVFSFLVSCALPADITLEATLPDGTVLDFIGELGLAPAWIHRPLDDKDKGWVSACMFARVNNHDVSIPISLRGPSHQLDADANERANWPLEEGAFYGMLFTPDDDPVNWIACRGRDLAAQGQTGGLVDRDCAAPDPANPGLTLCGFKFAGDCADFVAPANNFACEKFDDHKTFYEDCLDHDGFSDHHDGDVDNHGFCHREQEFKQVITTFTLAD